MPDKHVSIKQSHDFYSRLPDPKEFQTLKISNHNLTPLIEIDGITRVIGRWLSRA